jgi:hypothetical protein
MLAVDGRGVKRRRGEPTWAFARRRRSRTSKKIWMDARRDQLNRDRSATTDAT